MLIRPARPDEYDEIGELAVRVYLAEGYTRTDSRYNTVLRDVAPRAEKAELMVAVDDADRILGTVTYAGLGSPYAEHVSSPEEASFRMLVVDPAARGQGVGEALVRWCIDRAADSGVRSLRLSTQAGMAAAGRLYLRLGFARTPERDWSPEPGVELITYGRQIGRGSHSTRAMRSPSWTTSPSLTAISATTPADSASTGISIFIDSRITSVSPSSTLSPLAATTFQTFATISARISSAT